MDFRLCLLTSKMGKLQLARENSKKRASHIDCRRYFVAAQPTKVSSIFLPFIFDGSSSRCVGSQFKEHKTEFDG